MFLEKETMPYNIYNAVEVAHQVNTNTLIIKIHYKITPPSRKKKAVMFA